MPDLILVDISLPAMSGDRDKALAAGCNDYATKPVDLDSLPAKMEALLKRNLPA